MRMTMDIRKMMVVDDEIYRWAFASLVCAAMALVLAPAVLGPLGVAAGTVAVWKGGRWGAVAGVSASAVAAIIGLYLATGLMG